MPLSDALTSYSEVERRDLMHIPKHYNINRISIYYRSLIMENERQKQEQLNNNKTISVKINDWKEVCFQYRKFRDCF